jgi:hypothetical protein
VLAIAGSSEELDESLGREDGPSFPEVLLGLIAGEEPAGTEAVSDGTPSFPLDGEAAATASS